MEIVEEFTDLEKFCRSCLVFLEKREAENNLFIGLLNTLKSNIFHFSTERPRFFAVFERQKIVSAAMMTPPYNLILTRSAKRHLDALNDYFESQKISLPGALGPKETVSYFSKDYAKRRGLTATLRFAQRIFQISKLKDVSYSPGQMRKAVQSDQEIVCKWAELFAIESGLSNHEIKRSAKSAQNKIEQGSIFVWEDHTIKSMASFMGPTPNGIRIGFVYTPEDFRKRGYATSITAALSNHLLKQDRSFCFLFTDLSNPTSNSIYKKIGYEEVCDIDLIEFYS